MLKASAASEDEPTKQVTLRLPQGLLRLARRAADKRRVSLNTLLRQALERMAEEDRQALLRDAYDQLGRDADTDAEPFIPAQREVARRG